MSNQLIPLESVDANELIADPKTLEDLLADIKAHATDFEPDASTPAGRQKIGSQARIVSSSKVVIENALKALTDDIVKRKKLIDKYRKISREFCDELRDEILVPRDEWQAEEEARLEALALKAEIAADEEDAYAMDDLFNRERKVREHEERIEAERLEAEQKEREEREETERKEEEERIRKEAEDKARQDAEDEIQRQTQLAEKAEQDRKDAEERAEREKQEAIEEEQRKAREEADRVERERLRRIEDEEREAQQRAADRENRRKVNRSIVAALVKGGVSERAAKSAVTLIASGKIPSVSIRY